MSELLKASGKDGIDHAIALLPANSALKVVYYATILHAQNLRISALLDSDAEGDQAAKQDTLVNALRNKNILRTKDAYSGEVKTVEIEELLRETLLEIAKSQFGWDIIDIAKKQDKRPIVELFASTYEADFSKFKLAKAFLRWARDHSLEDLGEREIGHAQRLITNINKSLK